MLTDYGKLKWIFIVANVIPRLGGGLPRLSTFKFEAVRRAGMERQADDALPGFQLGRSYPTNLDNDIPEMIMSLF